MKIGENLVEVIRRLQAEVLKDLDVYVVTVTRTVWTQKHMMFEMVGPRSFRVHELHVDAGEILIDGVSSHVEGHYNVDVISASDKDRRVALSLIGYVTKDEGVL